MTILFLIILLLGIFHTLFPNGWNWLQQLLRQQRDTQIFYGNYVDTKAFYLKKFGKLPCISFVNNVDNSVLFERIQQGVYGEVKAIYQRNYYNWQAQRQEYDKTIFCLPENMLIELGDEYAEIYFDQRNYATANAMIREFTGYKAAAKEKEYEINIISVGSLGLELKPLNIKPTDLAIDLYYNDDFIAIDALIKQRLTQENDKGIILLHGLPGTGKTTYLRHLIGCTTKKILFVSPAVAGNLMNPEFIDLLIDNPNSILVIEDAENIIMDRKYSANSSVSNLLNLSDGLMSDCLNVQIICTFNSALELVDSALMRKGRLIAKYEFGKLSVTKAQQLSDHLGHDAVINKPMTLAEITNQQDMVFETKQVQIIGFRQLADMQEN
jgi:hypothetical protein